MLCLEAEARPWGEFVIPLTPIVEGKSCYKLAWSRNGQGNRLRTLYRLERYVVFFNFAVSYCWKARDVESK